MIGKIGRVWPLVINVQETAITYMQVNVLVLPVPEVAITAFDCSLIAIGPQKTDFAVTSINLDTIGLNYSGTLEKPRVTVLTNDFIAYQPFPRTNILLTALSLDACVINPPKSDIAVTNVQLSVFTWVPIPPAPRVSAIYLDSLTYQPESPKPVVTVLEQNTIAYREPHSSPLVTAQVLDFCKYSLPSAKARVTYLAADVLTHIPVPVTPIVVTVYSVDALSFKPPTIRVDTSGLMLDLIAYPVPTVTSDIDYLAVDFISFPAPPKPERPLCLLEILADVTEFCPYHWYN
jgi:hypothetical protein